MARREQAKAANRDKIKAAALQIIRTEGVDRLTMRHLAQTANVSLRTPYNLFGSKADVLLALLDGPRDRLVSFVGGEGSRSAIERLFLCLDEFERLFGEEERLYRAVFRAVMLVEQDGERQAAYDGLVLLMRSLLAQGVARQELEGDAQELGEHFAVLFLSVVGMWASGFFDLRACVAHIRRSWEAQLPARP